MPQATWVVNLVIADDHFNLPEVFVQLTYSLYHPRGLQIQEM